MLQVQENHVRKAAHSYSFSANQRVGTPARSAKPAGNAMRLGIVKPIVPKHTRPT